MTTIKRIFGATLLAIGMVVILLSLAASAGILVVITCPFLALALGADYWQRTSITSIT